MSPSDKQTDRPVLVQAPVQPLDASGFTASVVGTCLFALGVVASMMWDFPGPWQKILLTATALGLVLICYTSWHRNRLMKNAADAHQDSQPPAKADAAEENEETL